MAVTQNTYTGDGTTVLFSFTFPYLETTDIKVSLNGTVTTAYTLANATTIQFNTAPANGAAIRIYRQTDDSALAATFYPGSAIRSSDLNENFTQNLYVTQESSNNATTATTTANTALTNSTTAISTANTALSTANTAATNASAAVSTANTASTNASAAVSTANTASTNATAAVNTANSAASDAATALSTANTALSTANTASSNASAAVSTANTASTNATAAVSTANTAASNASSAVSTANTASSNASTALSTANTAISTANAAASAVANAILYDTVANVAAIPASPANNDAVEVVNSTGIESFTPLSGKPAGFVGDSGLSVRMVYTTTGATWNWIQYFPNDPETRYGDAITTVQGDVGLLQTDVGALQTDLGTAQTDISTLQSDVLGLDTSKYDKTGGTISGNATVTGELNVRDYLYKTVRISGTDYAVLYADNNSLSFARKNGTSVPSEIRFLGANPASDWTGITGSASVTGAHIWVLPTADGNAGQAMVTDGSGNLSFADALQITQLQNPSDNAPSVVLMPGKKVQVAGELELTDVIKIDSDPNSIYTTTLQQAVPASQNVSITLPSNNGTAGQALVTNGSGVTSWATVAPDLTVARTLTGAQTFNCPIVFNENGDDLDLRLEGDTTPNLVFLDASTDRIGINQAAPATRLDLNGAYSSNVTATGTTIDCSLGNYFTISVSANTTISVSNVPASRVYSFVLRIYHTGGTITWFTSNWPNATAPLLYTPKYHEFIFFTEDGGTTWRASYLTNFAS